MLFFMHVLRLGPIALIAVIFGTGCAYLQSSDDTLPAATTAVTSAVGETVPDAVNDNTTTDDTLAVTSPGASVPSETTTSTSTSTTTTTTTIPAPLGVDELILRADGIGAALFGTDPDSVVRYLTSVLGAPTDDSDWVDPSTYYACAGTVVRRVEWGVLAVMFGDESDTASGRAHLMSYTYGAVDRLGDEPRELRTSSGLTLGTTVAELRSAHPDVVLSEGDTDVDIPPSYFIPGSSPSPSGLLTGVGDDDLLLVVFGGSGCQA